MAEKPVLERKISISSESVRIPFNFDEIDSRFLAVDIEVVSRSDAVGTANFDRYVPRIWSGYWYLTNNNSIKKYGAIEFKRQRIYEKEFPNLAYGMNNAFFDTGAIFGLEMELSDLKAWYAGADFLANEENEANGLYLAHPVSELIIYIPVGVDLEVKISRQSYPEIVDIEPSSNPITGLDGELITPNPTKPLESANSDILEGIDRPPTLDDYVRDKGYILATECPNMSAQAMKERLDTTTADLQKLINRLLADGAISQSDIDIIKSGNPNISDIDLLKQLIDENKINSTELDKALERAIIESYAPPPNKKALWVVSVPILNSACQPAGYDNRGVVQNSNGSVNHFSLGTSASLPTANSINWGAFTGVSVALTTVLVFSGGFHSTLSCSPPQTRERVHLFVGGNFIAWISQTPADLIAATRIKYFIQP